MAKKLTEETQKNMGGEGAGTILRLEVENHKRVSTAVIQAGGKSVVLGGKNSNGKSSGGCDAILALLAGASAVCDRPIRDGATKALIGVELTSGMKIQKVITQGGVTLEARWPSGATVKKAQTVLSELTGGANFDISEFVFTDGKKRVEMAREIAGLDTDEIDDAILMACEERKDAKKEAKRLRTEAQGMPTHPEAPDDEVSSAAILDQIKEASAANEERAAKGAAHETAAAAVKSLEEKIQEHEKAVATLKVKIKARKTELTAAKEKAAARKERYEKTEQINVSKFQTELEGVNAKNNQVRANAAAKAKGLEADAAEDAVNVAEAKVVEVRAKRTAMVEAASFPVDGMTIEDGDVALAGIPFDQLGEAERYLVSAAVGLRAIPEGGIRVLLMRVGGALDEENLAKMLAFVAEQDAQLWIEVPRTDGVDIIFEDGKILEGEEAEEAVEKSEAAAGVAEE